MRLCWQSWINWWQRNWTDRPYQIGTRLHQYEIVHVLGIGSYGIAYLATDQTTNQLVVIKQVKPSLRNQAKGTLSHQYEAHILATLHHPRIPVLLDQFNTRDDAFIVMTFFQGISLEEHLFHLKEEWDEQSSVLFMLEIIEIVHYLHTHGIVHRDIRVPNVVLVDRIPHLIDFGLARYLLPYEKQNLPREIFELSKSENTLEQEENIEKYHDTASDFYAMGHFFLHLLYSGFSSSVRSENDVDDARSDKSWQEELSLSSDLTYIINKLLEAEAPYEHIDQLKEDLKALL
ncbi:serine/threonine protein kinase [Brevibacillus daliensis]|uniref:serine/threonine protein kinase n=1 Tax=Brevibacillus daliensis TaxID=2892995 RepID=UPI001E54C6D4|nr:protein kinase family protein [Brevibacillus daliensis]